MENGDISFLPRRHRPLNAAVFPATTMGEAPHSYRTKDVMRLADAVPRQGPGWAPKTLVGWETRNGVVHVG